MAETGTGLVARSKKAAAQIRADLARIELTWSSALELERDELQSSVEIIEEIRDEVNESAIKLAQHTE